MTDIREFRLWGHSDLGHVRSKIERGLATWSARWFQVDDPPRLLTLEAPGDAQAENSQWWALPNSIGDVYVALPPKVASKLIAHWLVGEGDIQGARANVDEEWCAGFVVGLMQDLMATVAAVPSPESHKTAVNTTCVALPTVFAQPTSGALLALIRLGGEQVRFALSPEYVKHVLKEGPKTTKPGSARVPAGEALESVPMRLRVGAWMEESLTIDALHGLAVGDVLVLGRKVDEPWPVIAPNGATIAQCYLGHQGAQQVIKLTVSSKELPRHVK